MKLSNHTGNEYENCAGNGFTFFGNSGIGRPRHPGNGTVVPLNIPGNGNIFVRNAATGYLANNGHYIAAYQTSYGSYGPRAGQVRESLCIRDTNAVIGNTSCDLPEFANSDSVSFEYSNENGVRHPLGQYISVFAEPSRLSIMATEKNFDQPTVITTTVTSQTTTTKHTTTAGSNMPLTFDKSFATSPQGVLAVIEAFYSLIAFIVVADSEHKVYKSGSFAFFMTVTFIVFFFTFCYYIGEVTHLRYKIQLPWTLMDMVVQITYVLLLLISSSLVAAHGYHPGHGSGATLGFVVMQLYLISLYLTIMQYRANRSLGQQSSGAMGVDNTGHTIETPPPGYGVTNPEHYHPGPTNLATPGPTY